MICIINQTITYIIFKRPLPNYNMILYIIWYASRYGVEKYLKGYDIKFECTFNAMPIRKIIF